MNYILEKKYNRAMKKTIKEKEQIDLIIDICEKHPALEMNLKGMIRAKEELEKVKTQINNLKEEAAKLNPVNDQPRLVEIYKTELPALEGEKNKLLDKAAINEENFKTFCEKNNIDIDWNLFASIMIEGNFSHNKGTGEIQALKTFKRMSKSYDRKIKNFEKCIQKIPGVTIDRPEQEENKESSEGTQGGNSTKGTEGKEESSKDETEGNNLPDKTYKWYEFGKKFSAWKERRRVQKEAKTRKDEPKDESKEENKTEAKMSKTFRDAYKYDIVKDYIDKQMKEIYQESAKETKQEAQQNKEENKDDEQR